MSEQTRLRKGKIPLLEHFYSIQGEGYNTGKAAYFIRTGGCDLACHWCDSKEAWSPETHNYIDINKIIKIIKKLKVDTVVVTGGEPLIYNFGEFCKKMKSNNIITMLETSGSYDISGEWDWICLSPKKQKAPKKQFYNIANELKVIIQNETDLEWAEICASKVSSDCKLFLQPEWSKLKEYSSKLTIDYIKNNTKWKMSVQLHKFLNIP